jgi:semaphorin 6
MDYLFLLVCSECVALQDPYCAWNAATSRCVTVASVALTAQSSLIQSIFTGYSDQCPDNGTRTFSKFFDISAFTKVCLYF